MKQWLLCSAAGNPSVYVATLTAGLLAGQIACSAPAAWVPRIVVPGLLASLLAVFTECKGWAWLGLVFCAGFLWGYGVYAERLHPSFPTEHVDRFGGEPLLLEGRLYREPEISARGTRWYLAAESVWHGMGAEGAQGRVLVTVRHAFREWQYGDTLRVPLRLRRTRKRNTEGLDYAAYLARRGIYHVAFLPNDWEATRVRRGVADIWSWAETLRRRVRRFMGRHLSSDSAALLNALVLGDRGGLSQRTKDSFADAGVAHLLSISGLHVSMLAIVGFVVVRWAASLSPYLLLRFNVLKIATLAAFLLVLFYTALAGGRIPTIRAAVMIGMYQLAVLSDRDGEVFASLVVAAFLLAVTSPGVVMEVSFQLSFLAVLFILLGLQWSTLGMKARADRDLPVNEPNRWHEWKRGLWLSLLVPFFATLGTGPAIAHYFGRMSLIGLVANPFIVPVVGFVAVPLGFLASTLALVFPQCGALLLFFLEPLMKAVLASVHAFAKVPLAVLPVPKPGVGFLVVFYIVFISLLWGLARRVKVTR